MIGILAGMGPKSTGPFVDKVVEECQQIYGAVNDIDFPHMMIYSCPTPFFINKPLDHTAMEGAIIEGARRLEKTGVDFIAIPCNTAHIYFKKINASLSIPTLNMVDETINKLPTATKKVAVLATQQTIESNIFQNKLTIAGFESVDLSREQHKVDQIIKHIKTGEINTAQQLWLEVSTNLAEKVDTAIIACTDLNVIIDHEEAPFPLVDSSTSLAQAIVSRYLSLEDDI
ncbi:broad specificity amino-acid racemase RacX [Paraliobacillus ryukyuensis]|uniref:Aspartate racemase n=1 Tax=Paraliobacillus ryukyuensis TaxID=200904 RepID=A0A366E0U8_9BACI|nr:amino acid racemase [Paraliobacillus ryukyuensis]RBO95399.1 aspartate racemase [Paraliobacillus ryukyuensis]